MLKRLFIKNIALISEIEIEWGSGFNALTGETGAGKSITVEALLLILGDRASADLIREGESKGIVEASFEIKNLNQVHTLLDEQGIEIEEHQLIVRREISSDGKSRAFVNGAQVNLAFLKSLGEHLVDLHGQHEHQSLLQPVHQREFLDIFAGLIPLRTSVQESFQLLQSIIQKKKELEASLRDRDRQLDFLRFQAKEIKDIHLENEEEDKIEEEIRLLSHSEKIQELVKSIDTLLNDADPALFDQIFQLINSVQELSTIDAELSSQVNAAEEIRFKLEDIQSVVKNKFGSIEYDPERLQYLGDRLLEIGRLKKKYGANLGEILIETEKKIEELEKGEAGLQEIETQIQSLQKNYDEKANRLRKERKSWGQKLSIGIVKELEGLGLKGSSFEIRLQEIPPSPSGMDDVIFYISTNVGHSPKPLHEVVSGGELSRIMLAIKTLLTKKALVPVLIFDEIDANLGGQTAHKVAVKLQEVSQSHQIIVITHLAQIAAYADQQYYVEKIQANKKVSTRVLLLSSEDRTKEIARMLGSAQISSVALTHAKELLSTAQKV